MDALVSSRTSRAALTKTHITTCTSGWNFEHAPGDGTTTLRLCQESFAFSTGAGVEEAASGASDSAPPSQLAPFELTAEMRAAAQGAQAGFEAFRNGLQLHFLA